MRLNTCSFWLALASGIMIVIQANASQIVQGEILAPGQTYKIRPLL